MFENKIQNSILFVLFISIAEFHVQFRREKKMNTNLTANSMASCDISTGLNLHLIWFDSIRFVSDKIWIFHKFC